MKTNLLLAVSLLMAMPATSLGEVFLQYFPGYSFSGVSHSGEYSFGSLGDNTAFVRDAVHGVRTINSLDNFTTYHISSIADNGTVAGREFVHRDGVGDINRGWIADGSLNPADFSYYQDYTMVVSGDGRFAFGSSYNVPSHRYSLTDGTSLSVWDPTGRFFGFLFFLSTSISYNGSVITGSGLVSGRAGAEAHVWTEAGGMVDLGRLWPNSYSESTAISPDGNVLVGASDNRSFIWTPDGGLQSLENPDYAPTGVSANGIIVGHSISNLDRDAFIYTEASGMRLLGTNMTVSGISGDGTTIVGYFGSAQDPLGFIAHDPTAEWLQLIAVPEPSDYAVCFAGASALFVAFRRYRKLHSSN